MFDWTNFDPDKPNYDYQPMTHPDSAFQLMIDMKRIDHGFHEDSMKRWTTTFRWEVTATGVYAVMTFLWLYWEVWWSAILWGLLTMVMCFLANLARKRAKKHQAKLIETDRAIANIRDRIPQQYHSLYNFKFDYHP